MRLRELQIKDAPLMLEWISDKTHIFDIGFEHDLNTIQDVESYIRLTESCLKEKHYAIVSDEDEYMGTVSLRHINYDEGVAEFSIVVRPTAMRKGYAHHGLIAAMDIAFIDLKLNSVYWRVDSNNIRALRFFTKHGLNTLDEDVPLEIKNRYPNDVNSVWFAVLKGDDYRKSALARGMVAGNKIVRIKTIPTIEAGELSFFEACHDINFEIKRIYYISKVPEGKRRGFHAHKELKQLLFCPYGEIQLILDDGNVREEITLNDPSIGIVIEKPTWREMLWLKTDSVLCVAASDYYKIDDYIRDYKEFKESIL